jgi:ubiquilin
MTSDGDRSQVTLEVELAANRRKKSIQTELDQTVEKFKLVLADLTGISPDKQCLVYKGRTLRNPQTLRSYG